MVGAVAILIAAPTLLAQSLKLRFLDVGQADAALIITPDGRRVVIDAGRSGAEVLAQLQAGRFDTLDLVIASHNHADHIGGMAAVLGSTVVRYYLDNGIPHTTTTYQRTIQAVEASGAQYLQATARTITVGSVKFRILPPPSLQVDQNNGSVGVLVHYGRFRALFTGDSELYELDFWLQHDSVPSVDIVKVAHHGSWNGTNLRRASPQAYQPQGLTLGDRLSRIKPGRWSEPDPHRLLRCSSLRFGSGHEMLQP